MKNKGITRVDITVTFLCMAFLFVTLGAIGNRGRRRAQQLVCGSQLGKWGQAIFMHSADNGDEIMFMVRRWGDYPFPHYMAALPLSMYETPPADYMRMGEFSVYLIKPYLDCIDDDFENNGRGTRLLGCPSVSDNFNVDWCWACWDAFCRPPHPASLPEYFIEPAYSYWNAGGPVPLEVGDECSANALEDLTFNVLSPDRLLMSDILGMDYDYGPYASFRYNHGVDGWCWSLAWAPVSAPPGHIKFDGEQDATGRSQLFGDGRVQWRPISLEFADNIPSEEYGVGFDENEWNGPGSGWVLRGLYSWY
jgi:hypothetical protein